MTKGLAVHTVGHKMFAAEVAKRHSEGRALKLQAVDLGMSESQLHHIVTCRRRPTIDQACSIKDKWGIPVEQWCKKKRGKKNG